MTQKQKPLPIPKSEYYYTIKYPASEKFTSPYSSSYPSSDTTRLIPGAQNALFSDEVVITADFMDEMLQDQDNKQLTNNSAETKFFREHFVSPFNDGKFKKILNRHGTLTENKTALSAYDIAEKILKKKKDLPKNLTLYQLKEAIFDYFQHKTSPIVPQP